MPCLDLDVAVSALAQLSRGASGQAPLPMLVAGLLLGVLPQWGSCAMNSLWGTGDAHMGPYLEICGNRKVE